MLYGTAAIVEVLVRHGADVSMRPQRRDPVMAAYGYGNPRMLNAAGGRRRQRPAADGLTVMDLVQALFEGGVAPGDRASASAVLDAGASRAGTRAAPRPSNAQPALPARPKRATSATSQILKDGTTTDRTS